MNPFCHNLGLKLISNSKVYLLEPWLIISIINIFDGGMFGRRGAGFVIRHPSSRLMVVGGSHLVNASNRGAELQAAWIGILYARLTLGAQHIIVERDSATVGSWLQRQNRATFVDPLLPDIWTSMQGCASLDIQHVYQEANSFADQIASFVAQHLSEVLWANIQMVPISFHDVLQSNHFGCTHTRLV